MELKGTWVNESGTLIYQVLPKCACSTIGQILYRVDHGGFFDGDIHDATAGVWKSVNHADQAAALGAIRKTIAEGRAVTFTCTRNPYTRLLACFLDKFCRVQRGGGMYRGDMVPRVAREYGIDLEGAFDQIKAFRKFLLFVRDTMKFQHPMEPDIHWDSMANHCRRLIANGGRFDHVIAMEEFDAGMARVLKEAELSERIDLAALPRFNDSVGAHPARVHPVEAYYDDLAEHIMRTVYGWDFNLFKYRHRPNALGPHSPVDPAEVNATLRQWA